MPIVDPCHLEIRPYLKEAPDADRHPNRLELEKGHRQVRQRQGGEAEGLARARGVVPELRLGLFRWPRPLVPSSVPILTSPGWLKREESGLGLQKKASRSKILLSRPEVSRGRPLPLLSLRPPFSQYRSCLQQALPESVMASHCWSAIVSAHCHYLPQDEAASALTRPWCIFSGETEEVPPTGTTAGERMQTETIQGQGWIGPKGEATSS